MTRSRWSPLGKIDIDVGPFAALFGEEAFEEEVHADGVDGGDAERVADGAVGGGAASLAQDALSWAKRTRSQTMRK